LSELLSREAPVEAPLKTLWGQGMMALDIAIGDDDTATIYLHKSTKGLLAIEKAKNDCADLESLKNERAEINKKILNLELLSE